ncbi:Protein kinase [Gurleya vavrai]
MGLIVKRISSNSDSIIPEIKFALESNHKNIVTTYLVIKDKRFLQKVYWIFMEYLPIKITMHNDYDLYENYAICENVCNGLKYLHNKKIVHLDIKHNNIMGTCKNLTENNSFALKSISQILSQIQEPKYDNIYTYELNHKYKDYDFKNIKNPLEIFVNDNFRQKETEKVNTYNQEIITNQPINLRNGIPSVKFAHNPPKKLKLDSYVLKNDLFKKEISKGLNKNDRIRKNIFFLIIKQNKNLFYNKKHEIEYTLKFYFFVNDYGIFFKKIYDKELFYNVKQYEELIKRVGFNIINEKYTEISGLIDLEKFELLNYDSFFNSVMKNISFNECQNMIYIYEKDMRYFEKNNFITDHLIYKIIDFGSAKIYESNKNTLEFNYNKTIPSISPEIYKKGCFFLNTDIWNLGIFSYQLFCKELPFLLVLKMHEEGLVVYKDYLHFTNLFRIKSKENRRNYCSFLRKCLKFAARERFNSIGCLNKVRKNLNALRCVRN